MREILSEGERNRINVSDQCPFVRTNWTNEAILLTSPLNLSIDSVKVGELFLSNARLIQNILGRKSDD